MSTIAPCKDCKDRKLGCHSTCQKYNDFRQAKDNIIAKKRIEYENSYNIIKRRKK